MRTPEQRTRDLIGFVRDQVAADDELSLAELCQRVQSRFPAGPPLAVEHIVEASHAA